mgnify:CR=1 FL=1
MIIRQLDSENGQNLNVEHSGVKLYAYLCARQGHILLS